MVPTISAFLTAEYEWSPEPLKANADKSFQGSNVLGLGFTMTPEEAQGHLARDARNAEVLFPYMNGGDLSLHPDQRASRWIINFWDWPLDRSVDDTWSNADGRQRERWLREGRVPADYPGRVAADFPELLDIVRRLVKPERDQNNRRERREKWWHFAEKCPALYHVIGRGRAFARHPEGWASDVAYVFDRLIVFAQTSKAKYPILVENTAVFDQKLVVIASSDFAHFAVLSSSIHYAWIHLRGGSNTTRPVYAPSDVYETFPFPPEVPASSTLDSLGRELDDVRRQAMARSGDGLTDLYNRFHSTDCMHEDVQAIRRIHCQIDLQVIHAYGWHDVELNHGFHVTAYIKEADKVRYTMCEPARLEVMRRLSALNRQRYQEEQDAAQSLEAAQAEQTAPRKRAGRPVAKRTTAQSVQTQLFE